MTQTPINISHPINHFVRMLGGDTHYRFYTDGRLPAFQFEGFIEDEILRVIGLFCNRITSTWEITIDGIKMLRNELPDNSVRYIVLLDRWLP